MNYKFGAYLIIPLKYSKEIQDLCLNGNELQRYTLQTMDINENIKNMFNCDGIQSVGCVYKLLKESLISHLNPDLDYFTVEDNGEAHKFHFLDSYLYVFNTKIAFLCLGLCFEEMEALRKICNPGYAVNPARFFTVVKNGEATEFSIDEWLQNICGKWGLKRFYNSESSMLLEAYTYVLALTDTMFPSLESLQKTTFNLHQMHNPQLPTEDASEADIRYAYAVKNATLNGYRWGCCVTSQTTAYAVADVSGDLNISEEMQTQAADGLPITLLALYEKYTCLRFTELIANLKSRNIKAIVNLKKLMLNFKAFGTVTPANLSRWNNVKQIYTFLLEVSETDSAVNDISTKIDILVAQQQEIENVRSTRIMNLITAFGIVGIMASVQEIVQILADGNNLMWNVTFLTVAILALCFGLAMRKK
ncbi:MAG: hypothetical protein E7560_01955 [Ruminococcaceae bacterium]|nr:hypothetical protein [Oscillospiraceae bacterium]